MNIFPLLKNCKGAITPSTACVCGANESQEVQVVLFQVCAKVIEIERLQETGHFPGCDGINPTKPAVYVATTLAGKFYVGWHMAPVNAKPGARFHYDHGDCGDQNQDAEYVWFGDVTAYVNFTYSEETDSMESEAWLPFSVNTNTNFPHSIEQEAVLEALRAGNITGQHKIVYVSLASPAKRYGAPVVRLELAYSAAAA